MSDRPFPPSVGSTQLRRATLADAPALGALRAMMRAESGDHPAGEIAAFERSCAAYFSHDLSQSQPILRPWVGCDGERVVATAVLMLLPTLPRFGAAESIDGRVRDVYVLPTHRRRGIARALMALLLADAQALRIDRLTLGASPVGRPLYESLGFVAKRDEMVYDPPRS